MRMLVLALSLAMAVPAAANEAHRDHAGSAAAPGCAADSTELACAAVATPAFGPDGRLVLTWSAGGRVMVATAAGAGEKLSAPVAVNPERQLVDDNGEARPVAAVDAKGRIAVAYVLRKDKAFIGTLMAARSTDGGRTFSAPAKVSEDPVSQRFAVLAAAPSGRMVLAWTDKRGQAAAKRAGQNYAGSALYATWSDDGGATFAPEVEIAPHACECCRLGLDFAADSSPVLLWRHVFPPGMRDHAVTRLDAEGRPAEPLRRVSLDEWRTDACPHHGPSLALAEGGTRHAAWFTGGQKRQGIFYARTGPDGSFAPPRPLGNPDNAPSHPSVLAKGGSVWLAWKEFDGTVTRVMLQHSTDDGATWSEPAPLAETAGRSDHPLLVGDGRRVFLSWLTKGEGWRLLPLEGGR